MRRAAIAFVATVAGLVLLLGYKTHGAPALSRPGAFAPVVPGPATTRSGTATPTDAPTNGSTAGDGTSTTRTLTGQPVDTPYGPVQVAVQVGGGRITNVQPLQLPQDRRRDIEIDNYAVPQLIQETIDAQSAQIDMVSGATFTSQGYIQSLQSALDQLRR